MEIINTIVGTPLGYVMRFCYRLLNNYGLAIILFTLITKIIMFPISLLVQKNSIKMVKMKPELDALRYQYVDDKDAYVDAQSALYKKEKYSPMAGVWPLLLQLPIIFGLLDVVYKPLKHLLHISADTASAFVARAAEISGMTVADLGSTAQLTAVNLVKENAAKFADIPGADAAIEAIKGLNTNFLGIDLTQTPSISHINLIFFVPIIAGLSALLMCWIQNRINVLQIEQNKLSQWGMTIFMIAFSTFFAFIVPAGVGLYWAWGNLFAIGVMYLVNIIYSPKKYFSSENADNMKLVFYSEGSGYYKYFKNLIEAIIEKSDITIHYVTSDPNDAIFKKNEKQIIPYYVDENRLISLMMKLECNIVVMTTPDLEKYHIKRSKVKRNIEYIYLDHGCSSLNLTYRTGALDYFNTIFAVSREQAIEVREIEKLRGTKKKKIVEYGYGLIDTMIKDYEASGKPVNEKKTILIAPSWQYDNIMDSCLDDLVEGLYGRGYKIVIRPHPQYVRRFPLKMKEIIEKYKDRFSDDFMIETDFSSNVTVYTADLLITDWSAISFEFSFTTNKPTLFINTEMKVVNKDFRKIKLKPFDITARNKIGRAIEKSEVPEIASVTAELLEHQDEYRDRIDELKHKHFYNLGHSGEVGADYIIGRLERRKKKKSAASSAEKIPERV